MSWMKNHSASAALFSLAFLAATPIVLADELWEDFEAFSLGSPNGQSGWQTDLFSDHEIVDDPTIEDQRSFRLSSESNTINLPNGGTESPPLLDLVASTSEYELPATHGYFRASFNFATADPPSEQHDHGISICIPTVLQDGLADRRCLALLYIFNLPQGLQVEYRNRLNYTLNTYQTHACHPGTTDPSCGSRGIIVASGLAHNVVHSMDIEMRLTPGSAFFDGAFTDIVMVTVDETIHYVAESSEPSLGRLIGSIAFGDAWTGSPDPYNYNYVYPGNGFLVDNVRLFSGSPRITDLAVEPNPVYANQNLTISAIASVPPARGIPGLVTTETGPNPGTGNWTVGWAQWFLDGSPIGMLQPQDGDWDEPVEIVHGSIPVPCCGEVQLCVTATDEIGGALDFNWSAPVAGIAGLPECVTIEVLLPDNDGDGVGDDDDPDDDNDGQLDSDEAACGGDPLDPAVLAPDEDGDGTPDCVDSDDDGDGVDDSSDNCPLVPNADQTDTDGDAFGDACDADDDNDTVDDTVDVCPGTTSPDGGMTATEQLGKNRWSLLDNTDGNFNQAAPQAGSKYSFTISDTRGCSCEQIVAERSLGANHLEQGCSTSTMIDWVNQ